MSNWQSKVFDRTLAKLDGAESVVARKSLER
jgi:hypothetical protein